jgi:hypothetical protein
VLCTTENPATFGGHIPSKIRRLPSKIEHIWWQLAAVKRKMTIFGDPYFWRLQKLLKIRSYLFSKANENDIALFLTAFLGRRK